MNYNGFTILGDLKSLEEGKIINVEIDSLEKRLYYPLKFQMRYLKKFNHMKINLIK